MHVFSERITVQLFTRKFSAREPKLDNWGGAQG